MLRSILFLDPKIACLFAVDYYLGTEGVYIWWLLNMEVKDEAALR